MIKFLKGTAVAYDKLSPKNADTFYLTTNDNNLYLGDQKLTNERDLLNLNSKLTSDEITIRDHSNSINDLNTTIKNIKSKLLLDTYNLLPSDINNGWKIENISNYSNYNNNNFHTGFVFAVTSNNPTPRISIEIPISNILSIRYFSMKCLYTGEANQGNITFNLTDKNGLVRNFYDTGTINFSTTNGTDNIINVNLTGCAEAFNVQNFAQGYDYFQVAIDFKTYYTDYYLLDIYLGREYYTRMVSLL